MELYKAEADDISQQIKDWLLHPENELECTFGKGGKVDATTFFQVAQRLRSKKLRELPQEDKITISTQKHIRFTLKSTGLIEQYCRDDTLVGKSFTAMIKERSVVDKDTIDIPDYEIRIKSRSERDIDNTDVRVKELLTQWGSVPKGFRLMRRWSFYDNTDGLRYDLSIVRSTMNDTKNPDPRKRGGFKWQRNFSDQNIAAAPYMYEVEVELQHMESNEEPAHAQKRLIKGVGEVLRAIQKNSILMRKSNMKKVLDSYKKLTKTDSFLGCKPVTLKQKNFGLVEEKVTNIRNGYNVTDKADGLRCLAYCNGDGELFLINMGMNIYRTGLSSIANRQSIVDGEWVTKLHNGAPVNRFMAFDIYYAVDEKLVSTLPFYNKDEEPSRYSHLDTWVKTFNKGDGPKKLLPLTFQTILQVSMKIFLFGKAGNSIFNHATTILDRYKDYETDGLIFTPNTLPLPGYDEKNNMIEPGVTNYEQFKWKPAKDNTIDFLVLFEKDSENKKLDKISIGVDPITLQPIRYKTMHLYVGSSRPLTFNPRSIVLNDVPATFSHYATDKYRAVLFNPMNFSDYKASTCYGILKYDPATKEEYVETKINEEPIQDMSIIEMSYDPSKDAGWRWIPSRIRHDKTEIFNKKILGGTLNAEKPANDVWNSIHDPITVSMIRTGSVEPTDAETNSTLTKIKERENINQIYWEERKGPIVDKKLTSGMRNFHNLHVKEVLLYNTTLKGGGKTVVDLGCGKGSDIERWNYNKVSFVLGIDYAGDNIMNTKNGVYARYYDILEENRKNGIEMAPMVFVIGDSALPLINGAAGSDEENKAILRSVFGRYNAGAAVPSYVDTKGGGLLKNGTDVMSCMFALHYFFQSKEKLNGILRNIRDGLKLGGYFIGCCFDGESVFDFLKGTPNGGTLTGTEEKHVLWNIRKEYDADEFAPNEESLGMKINVNFISIGAYHEEYLVSFPYLVEKMKEIGCDLVTDTQAAALGLRHGSEMFGTSYDALNLTGKKYKMTDDLKKFSFLNRWFIFMKTRDVLDEESGVIPLTTILKESVARGEKEDKEERFMNSEAREEIEEEEGKEEGKEKGKEKGKEEGSERTIPVRAASAAPQGKTYSLNQIFKFYFNAPFNDTLKMGDKEAARYISPQTPFKIRDFDEPSVIYPSIEHYMAGMVYKYGTNKPELAASLFSREGSIHQAYEQKKMLVLNTGVLEVPYEKDHELLEAELVLVKEKIRPTTIKKNYGAVFNETNFIVKRDELLRKAVKYRYDNDKRMRDILEAARKTGKYLLYYTESNARSNSNLGGIRKITGIIEGGNKLGKLYMDIAGFTNI